MNNIRKITVGRDYKTNSMHYMIGQKVYDDHTICAIIETHDRYCIFIQKGNETLPWKDFNKNMAISVEYDLNYD